MVPDSGAKELTVYIRLLGEGTVAFRPTRGELLDDDVVKLLPCTDYDPRDEDWEFPPESIVRCEKRCLGGDKLLIAVSRITKQKS